MALKGPLWLMASCLDEERARRKLTFLAARALDLGLRRAESTRGHVFQACGAVQEFFAQYPRHKSAVIGASFVEPYKPKGQFLRDWKRFLSTRPRAEYGRRIFGFRYNYDTLRGYLTPKYGGRRRGGGGGDNEFEIVIRLLAEFLS